MFVLVTFAVDAEFAPWRELRRFRKVKLNEKHWSGGADVYETQVGDCCVWVSLTGMGIKSFDFKSATCLRSAGIDAIISSGLCGGLSTRYRVGQIIVPKRVGTLRDVAGLSTAASLADLAERQGATVVETLLTADHIIDSEAEKARLSIRRRGGHGILPHRPRILARSHSRHRHPRDQRRRQRNSPARFFESAYSRRTGEGSAAREGARVTSDPNSSSNPVCEAEQGSRKESRQFSRRFFACTDSRIDSL
jgi:hypothetical protein